MAAVPVLLKLTGTVSDAPAARLLVLAVMYGTPLRLPLALIRVTPAGRPPSDSCNGPLSAAPLVLLMVSVPVHWLVARASTRPEATALTLLVTSVFGAARFRLITTGS